jgi:hypothetical protein
MHHNDDQNQNRRKLKTLFSAHNLLQNGQDECYSLQMGHHLIHITNIVGIKVAVIVVNRRISVAIYGVAVLESMYLIPYSDSTMNCAFGLINHLFSHARISIDES